MITQKGVCIYYGDVAPDAKENFNANITNVADFSNINILSQYNADFKNYVNPCEKYQTVLDGKKNPFPLNTDKIGIWSDKISDEEGIFLVPIVLTLTATEGTFNSAGFTFIFDEENNIYSNNLDIVWYLKETEVANASFQPNSANYFCEQRVTEFDKVQITFNSINFPKSRLRLNAIDYGYGTVFYGKELQDVKLIQEIDPLMSELQIGTCDIVISPKGNVQYSFQNKQPLNVYYNGELKVISFIDDAKRTSEKKWKIKSYDYIGILDMTDFPANDYTNKNAVELIQEIFTVAEVPYEIDEEIINENIFLKGWLISTNFINSGDFSKTNCRYALQQVCFAIGAVVDAFNGKAVRVRKLKKEVSQHIPKNRILNNQSFNYLSLLTSLTIQAVTDFEYSEDYMVENESLSAEDIEAGNNIFEYTFKLPHGKYAIYNRNTGNAISQNNYIILESNAFKFKFKLLRSYSFQVRASMRTGVEREPVIRENSLGLLSKLKRDASINNATFVNDNNVNEVMDRCYDWLSKTEIIKSNIVEGKHIIEAYPTYYGEMVYGEAYYESPPDKIEYDSIINVGDLIDVDTEYYGTKFAKRVTKQTYNLNGNIVIKEVEMR